MHKCLTGVRDRDLTSANLNDARYKGSAMMQHLAKSKSRVRITKPICSGVGHDVTVVGICFAYFGPVNGYEALESEPLHPDIRQIFVDQQFHADLSSTSRPEASYAP